MNIILVDDDPKAPDSLTHVVSSVLSDRELHRFTRTSEAMAFAEEHLIDIAFLAINKRTCNGLTLARSLQELYPKVNIVFCTQFPEYAIEAHELYCSAFLLKPITEEQVRQAIDKLRYPLTEINSKVEIKCSGEFAVYCDGEPVRFKYSRTKELLAYLVDRNGAECSTAWASAILFGDEDHTSYLKQLRKDLIDTFAAIGHPEVIRSTRGALSINRHTVQCDYFDYCSGKRAKLPDDYMKQFDFM